MFVLRNIAMRSSASVKLKHQWSVSKSKRDPGIKGRAKLLEPSELEEVENIDDLESDFMDVHKSHKQYLRDVDTQNERLKYLIVKRKYFKQKFPNFLTWHDKEQIKYLHSTDPEEWTIDRLSESFPALPEVIQKVIRAKYSKNEPKIARHDESVQKNWELFEKGEMPELPQSLVEHLRKFTSRSQIYKSIDSSSVMREVVNISNTFPKGEFSEIISSYQKLKKRDDTENQKPEQFFQPLQPTNPSSDKDTYLTTDVYSKNMVTLSSLEQKIEKRVLKGAKISEEDKLILLQSKKAPVSSQPAPVFNEEDLTAIMENKYETRTVIRKAERDYSHLMYPEKIIIPKDKVKRGMTYKLNDCYYDSDGTFLYRVPGM